MARFCGAISFLSSLPSSFCLSFSLSFVVVKKAPRPFCFFFDFFPSFGRDHGSVKRQSSPATGSKKKNQDDSFFGLVFKARLCHHQQILSFSDCARKSSIATKKTTYSHTRYNSKKNVFRSFLLCWHQSRRQDERPRLCFLEKSVGASLRRKKTLVRVLVLNFFFCKSALFERARG